MGAPPGAIAPAASRRLGVRTDPSCLPFEKQMPGGDPHLAEGKTKAEIMRCLKRYVVRELFAAVQTTCTSPTDEIAA